jgi:hypothetical protein
MLLNYNQFTTQPGERCTARIGGIRRISDAFHWNALETHRKMEAIFQSEFSRVFFDDFRPFPTGKYRELAGIHWEKVRKTASISGAFPQDTVARIFVLGNALNNYNRANVYDSMLAFSSKSICFRANLFFRFFFLL